MTPKITSRDPVLLSVHPALKHIPQPVEEELKPIRVGMIKGGEISTPIYTDEEGRILDDTSRTTWLCAKLLGYKEVAVCICPAAQVHLLIIRDLAHRRHFSKSAVAYLAVPHLQPALEAARLARLEKLRKGQEIPVVASGDDGPQTMEEMAAQLGFERKLLFEAQSVRKAFDDKKKYVFNVQGGATDGATVEMTLKEWFEPRLLRAFVGGEHEQNRPMGLGGILAGITAVRAGDKSKFNPKNQGQLNLFENKVDVVNGWKYWTKLSPEDRKQHFKNFDDRLEFIPEDQRDDLADYFETLAKKVRKAAKSPATD